MATTSTLVESLVEGLGDVAATRYSHLAAAVIIVTDHLFTLDDEVGFIWPSKWSLGKVLFFINRYYNLASVGLNLFGLFSPNITDKFCYSLIKWQGWTTFVAPVIAQAIILMRVYALFLLDKRVLGILIGSLIVSATGSAIIMGLAQQSFTATSTIPLTGVKFCVPKNLPNTFWLFWLPIIAYEFLLCGLVLFRVASAWRREGKRLYLSDFGVTSVLVRDSIIYFFIMFTVYAVNFLIWLLARPTLLEVPAAFTVSLSTVLGNRMIFNLHEAHRQISQPALASAFNPNLTLDPSQSQAHPRTLDIRSYVHADNDFVDDHKSPDRYEMQDIEHQLRRLRSS